MTKPNIFITRSAWDQIMAAVLYQDLEVQWFARGEYLPKDDERGDYIMYEIIIPPQEVQGAFTDTGEAKVNIDALNTIISEAQALGSPIFGWGNWGHSHVKMGTTPSATDWESMKLLAEMWGKSMGIVVNQRGEVTGYGMGPHPLFEGLYVEMRGVTVAVEPMATPQIENVTRWMKSVTKKTYTSSYGAQGFSAFCTKVEEVINEAEDPTSGDGFIFLSAKDYEAIKALPDYEEKENDLWDKYTSAGWKAMTPWERKLLLPALENATWSKRREKALVQMSGTFYDDNYWGQYE